MYVHILFSCLPQYIVPQMLESSCSCLVVLCCSLKRFWKSQVNCFKFQSQINTANLTLFLTVIHVSTYVVLECIVFVHIRCLQQHCLWRGRVTLVKQHPNLVIKARKQLLACVLDSLFFCLCGMQLYWLPRSIACWTALVILAVQIVYVNIFCRLCSSNIVHCFPITNDTWPENRCRPASPNSAFDPVPLILSQSQVDRSYSFGHRALIVNILLCIDFLNTKPEKIASSRNLCNFHFNSGQR